MFKMKDPNTLLSVPNKLLLKGEKMEDSLGQFQMGFPPPQVKVVKIDIM